MDKQLGLLLILLFIISLGFYNEPNFLLTNKVAYATIYDQPKSIPKPAYIPQPKLVPQTTTPIPTSISKPTPTPTQEPEETLSIASQPTPTQKPEQLAQVGAGTVNPIVKILTVIKQLVVVFFQFTLSLLGI